MHIRLGGNDKTSIMTERQSQENEEEGVIKGRKEIM